MLMLLASGLVGIFGFARHRSGLWGYLVARAEGQTAVELERERNRATATVLQLLPDGGEILEYEHGGRLRVIRKNVGADRPVTAGPDCGPGGEVKR